MRREPTIWTRCYEDSWDGIIDKESFSHPAKFARGLIQRIYKHGFDHGWWKRGDLIGDPFGGVGLGGVVGVCRGLRWVGVELEPKFVALAKKNLARYLHIGNGADGNPLRIVQGDSREFAKLVGTCDAICTSPPYEGTSVSTLGNYKGPASLPKGCGDLMAVQGIRGDENYGKSVGQIGNDSGETYWAAMRTVYEQCRLALKPGGMLVAVLKDYVKNGQRVPLCDQTCTLLASLGFAEVECIRAMLVEEYTTNGLFGDVVKKKERKSFFRRLAESKGAPPIDWEEVLCFRKRAGHNAK